jgi:hypothetical protein
MKIKTEPINIHEKGKCLYFEKGIYEVFFLGGFSVELNEFSLLLKHLMTNKFIECKNVNWPLQTYNYGKRAKKKLKIEIENSGTYELFFINSNSINLKKSNLKSIFPFLNPKVIEIKNDEIEVFFKKK